MIDYRMFMAQDKTWKAMVEAAKKHYSEAELNSDRPYGLGNPEPQKLGPENGAD